MRCTLHPRFLGYKCFESNNDNHEKICPDYFIHSRSYNGSPKYKITTINRFCLGR